jgi:hypothetical protein
MGAAGVNMLKYLPGYGRVDGALRQRYDPHGGNPFLRFAPPGHVHSPLPDLGLVDRDQARLFDRTVTHVPGIDLQVGAQLDLVAEFSKYYGDLPFADDRSRGLRYYFRNEWFSYGDAIVLYSMLRHVRPRRMLEIGSGFSSAVMADTNDRFLDRQVALTFVDPHPERLLALLGEGDKTRCEILAARAQDVPLGRFSSLEPGDVLFIDSSHVAKVGSDVVHLVTTVLPVLAEGVIIHFHDVFWPFEYPEEWVREGRAWTENYLLKAFLQFNESFKILCFNSYLAQHHLETVARHLPSFPRNPGASLWLKKVA